jgi:hypothetical protein
VKDDEPEAKAMKRAQAFGSPETILRKKSRVFGEGSRVTDKQEGGSKKRN